MKVDNKSVIEQRICADIEQYLIFKITVSYTRHIAVIPNIYIVDLPIGTWTL